MARIFILRPQPKIRGQLRTTYIMSEPYERTYILGLIIIQYFIHSSLGTYLEDGGWRTDSDSNCAVDNGHDALPLILRK